MSALLRNNADPNIINKLYSQTPTHLAIINKVDENTLIEFNMSKADIYNYKDKYDKCPFDYAKESGDQNYINLLKKIFGENNNIINGSNKQKKVNTEKIKEYNNNESPDNINNEYKNNTNFENRKVLFSFEENYLNKDNSSVIIKSIEDKNLLFNDETESKIKKKDDEKQESEYINSSEEKNKSKMNKTQEIKEDLKLNGKSQEKDEIKNNSTDTIKKLSLSNSGEKVQFKIERNDNYTINNNQNKTNEDINISNENKNSLNKSKKSNQNDNSLNNKNNVKDISEMNPLDMINQVITTSSNVFSELQMNSNTIKNNQSDEYFNNKSGRENTSNFLTDGYFLKEINLPALKVLEHNGISYTANLERISMPNVEKIDDDCLQENRLVELDLPELKELGTSFMTFNNSLKKLSIPKVSYIPKGMLAYNNALEYFYAPSAKELESFVLIDNGVMKSFIAPNMSKIYKKTLLTLKENTLPNLEHLHLADRVKLSNRTFCGTITESEIEVGNIEGKEEIERFKSRLKDESKVKRIEK